MASQEGQQHIPTASASQDDADSNQPRGQQNWEVVKELMEVKQELAKMNAELLAYRDKAKEQEQRSKEQEKRINEQERTSKELLDEVRGLGAEVRGAETNQKPNMKELRVDTAFEFQDDKDTSTRVDKAGIVRGSTRVDKEGIVRGGQEVYAFNESVWDSLIFLGQIQGSYEGVDMIILGILNLLIQIFFCIILVTSDLADDGAEVYTEAVNAFIQWRIGVAHQAEHYDPLTNSSLAQRVCLQYGGTIESRRHQNDLAVASSYYDVKKLSEFQGPGLLMLALALWMALILKEVVSILGFTRMLVALALNGHGKTELVHEDSGEQLVIRSMSKKRAWSIFFTVVVPRLFISLMLGYVGIFYLRQTFGVEEIILNAMALGFVLEIDELLFNFLPAAARYLVTHIDAVPLDLNNAEDKVNKAKQGSRTRKLLSAIFERTRVLMVILVVVVIYFRFTIIAQIQDSMEISQLILCEGNRQFIFKQSRATKVLHLAQTVDTDGEDEMNLPRDEILDVFDAILQATNLCNELENKKDLQDRLELCDPKSKTEKDPGMWCDRCPYLLSLGQDSQLWKDESLEDTITLVTATRNEALSSLECEDRYTTLNETFIPAPMNELLAQAGANFSAALCADIEPYCLHPDLQIREVVRIFCPSQCQCDHGTSGTVNNWFFDRIGCAPTCQDLVNSELTQLEDDLVLGKETCTDRDGGLAEEQWRSYVEDVEREFIKRGWLYAEGGFYYASASIAGFFAVKTEKDMSDFAATVLHSSNQATIQMDGCTLPRVPIDLMAWAKAAGSFCRWARIVKYVFGLNLCSHTILLADGFYGSNALGGLCPLSCGIGSCSQIQPDGDIDSNLNAWYNVVPWGQDAKYNFACDRENLLCVEVEKWANPQWSWPADWRISIIEDVANGNVVYDGDLEVLSGADSYEKDVACMRPIKTNSSCYVIESTDAASASSHSGGMRWRLTEVGTGQFLMVGSHTERHRACGLNWLNDLGVRCHQGEDVTLMTSWYQMRVDYEVMLTDDPTHIPDNFFLRGNEHRMFGHRRALLLGGYDGTSVQILYSQDVIGGRETVPLSNLALPTPKASDAGQGFAACLPSSELSELQQDKTLCVDSKVASLECSEFVSRAHCETTIGFVREFFETNGCESDLDGLSDDDTIAQLCPVSCAIQAACPIEVDDGSSLPSYSSYYTFELAGCLGNDCECLPPWNRKAGEASVVVSCWMELNLTSNWAQGLGDSSDGSGCSTITTPWPAAAREKISSVIKEGIYCASEEAGFPPRSDLLTNMSQWCYVKPACLGAKPSLNAATCSWRPTFETDCKKDRSDPMFCLQG